MTTYDIPFLLSSDPLNGALNIDNNGSSFSIAFERPIIIPKDALNIKLKVYNATVWWNVPNVDSTNNAFRLTYFDGVLSVQYDITIPTGLYDVSQLDNAINRELVNQGAPNNLITLIGDNSTQKSIIQINVLTPMTVSIDFTIANSLRTLLGFDSQVIPAQSGLVSIYSDNTASFNSINYFLIHTDLIGYGIRIGDSYNNTICKVPINVVPGSQIDHDYINPIPVPCNEIQGRVVNEIKVWLTNNSNAYVNTLGEYFSVTIVLSYEMPHRNELGQIVL